MSADTKWAVEHTTTASSGVRFFDTEPEAQEWATEQYGAVTLVVSFQGEYPPDRACRDHEQRPPDPTTTED